MAYLSCSTLVHPCCSLRENVFNRHEGMRLYPSSIFSKIPYVINMEIGRLVYFNHPCHILNFYQAFHLSNDIEHARFLSWISALQNFRMQPLRKVHVLSVPIYNIIDNFMWNNEGKSGCKTHLLCGGHCNEECILSIWCTVLTTILPHHFTFHCERAPISYVMYSTCALHWSPCPLWNPWLRNEEE